MSKPPFVLTPKIFNLVSSVQELVGELKNVDVKKPSIKLRKENKIKTIRHSLAIEGNTLSEEQITALIEKKRVVGPSKQVQEVLNALDLYEKKSNLNPLIEKDLLKSHKILMNGLVPSAGKYRSGNVGILKGKKIGHVAPQAKFIPKLMNDLFSYIKTEKEISFLLKACIFHYELEFIHPFEDGNGRMGRLWQQLLLMKHADIFEYLSIETLIHQEQKRYYKVLEECDRAGDCTTFIEFSLELILKSLENFKQVYRPTKILGEDRLLLAREHFKTNSFSRKDYLSIFTDISTATASRDLQKGVEEKSLQKTGDKALAIYRFKKS